LLWKVAINVSPMQTPNKDDCITNYLNTYPIIPNTNTIESLITTKFRQACYLVRDRSPLHLLNNSLHPAANFLAPDTS